jgi:N-formylglutamate amidohydrolase
MRHYDKILAHIPHSSIADYSFGWLSAASMFPVVKRLTDWHTELLFTSSNPKVESMVFPHSRFYLDVERLENDPMEEIGQGKIYTCYEEFTRALLSKKDAVRLNGIYDSWKRDCAERITDNTLVVDCHSFPSDVCRDIDVCIGFNEDNSKPDVEVLVFIKKAFSDNGFRVAYNVPYSNSVVFNDRHHSVMLEINKGAYMDEETLVMRPDAYKLGNTIHQLYDVLTDGTIYR